MKTTKLLALLIVAEVFVGCTYYPTNNVPDHHAVYRERPNRSIGLWSREEIRREPDPYKREQMMKENDRYSKSSGLSARQECFWTGTCGRQRKSNDTLSRIQRDNDRALQRANRDLNRRLNREWEELLDRVFGR